MSGVELGATLYFPATRPDLETIARGGIPGLRSAVICLEDAVAERDRGAALGNLVRLLLSLRLRAPRLRLYARPRDPLMLRDIARMAGVDALEGFVLPKARAGNLDAWLAALPSGAHRMMPTIECAEAFDAGALRRLRDALLPHRERVTAVRVGGNDILGLLGTRRSRVRTAWEGPLANVLRDVAGTFLPAGFDVAAPVFEHYGEPDTLAREVELDLEHGLLTKTAIHPSQIDPIHAAYRPSREELTEARAILAPDASAVFGRGGSLCEPATHRGWALRTLERARVHGVEPEPVRRAGHESGHESGRGVGQGAGHEAVPGASTAEPPDGGEAARSADALPGARPSLSAPRPPPSPRAAPPRATRPSRA